MNPDTNLSYKLQIINLKKYFINLKDESFNEKNAIELKSIEIKTEIENKNFLKKVFEIIMIVIMDVISLLLPEIVKQCIIIFKKLCSKNSSNNITSSPILHFMDVTKSNETHHHVIDKKKDTEQYYTTNKEGFFDGLFIEQNKKFTLIVSYTNDKKDGTQIKFNKKTKQIMLRNYDNGILNRTICYKVRCYNCFSNKNGYLTNCYAESFFNEKKVKTNYYCNMNIISTTFIIDDDNNAYTEDIYYNNGEIYEKSHYDQKIKQRSYTKYSSKKIIYPHKKIVKITDFCFADDEKKGVNGIFTKLLLEKSMPLIPNEQGYLNPPQNENYKNRVLSFCYNEEVITCNDYYGYSYILPNESMFIWTLGYSIADSTQEALDESYVSEIVYILLYIEKDIPRVTYRSGISSVKSATVMSIRNENKIIYTQAIPLTIGKYDKDLKFITNEIVTDATFKKLYWNEKINKINVFRYYHQCFYYAHNKKTDVVTSNK